MNFAFLFIIVFLAIMTITLRNPQCDESLYSLFTIYNHVNDICRLGQVSKGDMCDTEPSAWLQKSLGTLAPRYNGASLNLLIRFQIFRREPTATDEIHCES